jgi:antitoxin (DNA-binding transcriptional repressor) of toxin-antitoxin stability system
MCRVFPSLAIAVRRAKMSVMARANTMKTIDVADLQKDLQAYLDEIDRETIVVTRQGKPCAVIHGVGDDLETAELSHSAQFWQMIEQRRREPTIPWEKAKQELG